jgi:hypothetical protein
MAENMDLPPSQPNGTVPRERLQKKDLQKTGLLVEKGIGSLALPVIGAEPQKYGLQADGGVA